MNKLIYLIPVIAMTASAAEPRACGTGTLLDVEVSTETQGLVQAGSIPKNNKGLVILSPNSRQKKIYRVTIALGEMTYTAQSSGDFFGYNPTKLIVNDPIEACAVSNKLIIKRPDGKEYKPSIIKTVRNSKNNPA